MGDSFYPLFILIGSNIVYQCSSKNAAKAANPFAALVMVYLIGAILSLLLFLATKGKSGSLIENFTALNHWNYLLGFAIVGLEGGFLYLYRAGWDISIGPICSYVGVAIGLLVVGGLCFHEHITIRQVLGTILALAGIALISIK